MDHNGLKSLNLSYNVLNEPYKGKAKEELHHVEYYNFESVFSQFLQKTRTLLHLNMSGTQLTIDSLCSITEKGFRKNKTLIGIHLSRIIKVENYELQKFREILGVKTYKNEHNMAEVDQRSMYELFQEKSVKDNEAIINFAAKLSSKTKELAQDVIGKSLVAPIEERSFTYQRVLGHPEMLNAHHWRENSEPNCQICEKRTLCFFVWNKRMASLDQQFFYKHSSSEPVQLKTAKAYDYPILFTADNQIIRMLNIVEFMERLSHG